MHCCLSRNAAALQSAVPPSLSRATHGPFDEISNRLSSGATFVDFGFKVGLEISPGIFRFQLGLEPCFRAMSDQFFGPPLAVVASGDEQPVSIFQQLA
jgi:hypothetical protein